LSWNADSTALQVASDLKPDSVVQLVRTTVDVDPE
jgi:hypothetical protein